jgi:predicted dehydrogenase
VSRRYGVAIVGCGIGRLHAEAWAKLPDKFQIVAVCDLNAELAGKVASEFGVQHAAERLEAVLPREDVDIVDICTPPALHRPMIEAALDAGKHVICEKPLTGSLADTDAIIARAAQSPGRHVMPIFQYRYGMGLQKLLRLIERGVTGKLYSSLIETAWLRGPKYYSVPWRGKWKTELGGCLTTHAIHAHDMLCSVAGPVAAVFARTATRVNTIEVEDCASASLLMRDGSLASLSVTLGSMQEISRLRFCFESLTAESALEPYNPGAEPWRFIAASPEIEARIQAALADFTPTPERFTGQFLRLHEALEGGAKLPVTLADARASLELLTALYHSAATGAEVRLPIGPDHPRYRGWTP